MNTRDGKPSYAWLGYHEILVMLLPYVIYLWNPKWLFHYIKWNNHVFRREGLRIGFLILILFNRYLYSFCIKKGTPWTIFLGGLAPVTIFLLFHQIARFDFLFLIFFIVGAGYIAAICWQYARIRKKATLRKTRYLWKKGKKRIAICVYMVLLASSLGGLKKTPATTYVLPAIETAPPGSIWDANQEYLTYWKTETFNELSPDGKKELCEKLIQMECMYHSLESIDFVVEEYSQNTLMGYYSHSDRLISISAHVLSGNRSKLLNTILHEFHHSYAHELAESDYTTSDEASLYKEGFLTYKEDYKNWNDYYYNPVEVAARRYANLWTLSYLEYVDSL